MSTHNTLHESLEKMGVEISFEPLRAKKKKTFARTNLKKKRNYSLKYDHNAALNEEVKNIRK